MSIKDRINRVVNYLKIPKRGSLKIGAEDTLSNELAVWLRMLYLEGILNAVFVHIANEAAGKLAMVRKKYIGLVSGCADWIIVSKDTSLFLELKVKPNKQSKNQVLFQEWCDDEGVHYAICYSIEEAQYIIRKVFNI